MQLRARAMSVALSAVLVGAAISGCNHDEHGGTTAGNPAADGRMATGNAPESLPKPKELITPVFPDSSATAKLDYPPFAKVENGGVAMTPMPPGREGVTTVMVMPHEAGYDVVVGNDQCKGTVILSQDGKEIAKLSRSTIQQYHLPATGDGHTSGLELTATMSSDSEVNWNCNVTVTPVH